METLCFLGRQAQWRQGSGSTERFATRRLPNHSSRGNHTVAEGLRANAKTPNWKVLPPRVPSERHPRRLKRHIFQRNIEPVKANLKLFAPHAFRNKHAVLFCRVAVSGLMAKKQWQWAAEVPPPPVLEENGLLWCEVSSVLVFFTSHLATGGALNSEGGGIDVTHKGFALKEAVTHRLFDLAPFCFEVELIEAVGLVKPKDSRKTADGLNSMAMYENCPKYNSLDFFFPIVKSFERFTKQFHWTVWFAHKKKCGTCLMYYVAHLDV